MKAIVYDTYGAPEDVLSRADIGKPAVADDEVLVQVRAAGLNPYDWHFMRGLPYPMRVRFGLRRPKRTTVLGSDMAGNVEAVGKDVTRFAPGDEVYAEVSTGGCAEYVGFSAAHLTPKAANLSFEETAAVPMAGMTALAAVRDKAAVQSGQRVLINGASGGVGTFAVQIAKAFGAEVTGVCSTRNVDLVKSIGADHVIDYTEEDFTGGAERYDFILDTVGNHSVSECRAALTSKGTYATPGGGSGKWFGPLSQQLAATVLTPFVGQTLVAVNDKPNQDLQFLNELIEAGKVMPVVDRVYPLDEASDAMTYLEAGRARGKVVVSVGDAEK